MIKLSQECVCRLPVEVSVTYRMSSLLRQAQDGERSRTVGFVFSLDYLNDNELRSTKRNRLGVSLPFDKLRAVS
jgi:hypothetical protein